MFRLSIPMCFHGTSRFQGMDTSLICIAMLRSACYVIGGYCPGHVHNSTLTQQNGAPSGAVEGTPGRIPLDVPDPILPLSRKPSLGSTLSSWVLFLYICFNTCFTFFDFQGKKDVFHAIISNNRKAISYYKTILMNLNFCQIFISRKINTKSTYYIK